MRPRSRAILDVNDSVPELCVASFPRSSLSYLLGLFPLLLLVVVHPGHCQAWACSAASASAKGAAMRLLLRSPHSLSLRVHAAQGRERHKAGAARAAATATRKTTRTTPLRTTRFPTASMIAYFRLVGALYGCFVAALRSRRPLRVQSSPSPRTSRQLYSRVLQSHKRVKRVFSDDLCAWSIQTLTISTATPFLCHFQPLLRRRRRRRRRTSREAYARLRSCASLSMTSASARHGQTSEPKSRPCQASRISSLLSPRWS